MHHPRPRPPHCQTLLQRFQQRLGLKHKALHSSTIKHSLLNAWARCTFCASGLQSTPDRGGSICHACPDSVHGISLCERMQLSTMCSPAEALPGCTSAFLALLLGVCSACCEALAFCRAFPGSAVIFALLSAWEGASALAVRLPFWASWASSLDQMVPARLGCISCRNSASWGSSARHDAVSVPSGNVSARHQSCASGAQPPCETF